ncbi:uncharacterized protein N7459_003704 [Penicillium hispanicum]|uniref:uncharacterized protein n=1 Tax=Penicillium hispanicum TaxID=1080232 RepID=UPI00254031C1|nr:uncharacterized protein N7459_003704 [Penicillium hispanicum]KAJ5587939.1 hypothetical protein N7459_003704 [Penicillium hispanicum]
MSLLYVVLNRASARVKGMKGGWPEFESMPLNSTGFGPNSFASCIRSCWEAIPVVVVRSAAAAKRRRRKTCLTRSPKSKRKSASSRSTGNLQDYVLLLPLNPFSSNSKKAAEMRIR